MINDFYTDAERAEPHTDNCDGFVFNCRTDLSGPIIVTTKYAYGDLNNPMYLTKYTQAVAAFVGCWTARILPRLNGFSGFGNLDFKLEFCYPVLQFVLSEYTDIEIKLNNIKQGYIVPTTKGYKYNFDTFNTLEEAKEAVIKYYKKYHTDLIINE